MVEATCDSFESDYIVGYSSEDDYGAVLPVDADYVLTHVDIAPHNYQLEWHDGDSLVDWSSWTADDPAYDRGAYLTDVEYISEAEAVERGHLLHFAADGYGEVALRGDADVLVYEALDVKDNDYVVFFDGDDVIEGEGKWSVEDHYVMEYDFDRDRYDSGLWVSEIPSDVDVIPLEDEEEAADDDLVETLEEELDLHHHRNDYRVVGPNRVEASYGESCYFSGKEVAAIEDSDSWSIVSGSPEADGEPIVLERREEHPWERPMDRMERPMTADFEKESETTWYAVLGEKEVEALERVGFWPFYDSKRDTFTLALREGKAATHAEKLDFDAVRIVEEPEVGDTVELA